MAFIALLVASLLIYSAFRSLDNLFAKKLFPDPGKPDTISNIKKTLT